MTDPASLLPVDPSPKWPDAASFKEAVEKLMPIAVFVGVAYLAFRNWTEETERKVQEAYLRGERLVAYRTRHRWKSSDVRPLLSIGVNGAAQRRMAALKGKGRPVVKTHRPLEKLLLDKLTTWTIPFSEDATPAQRRHSFKDWPWWKHHVEALYRGELKLAQTSHIKGAHDAAERAVAVALRISQGKVHAICGDVRALRREDAEAANFPPMVLAEYEAWMEHGELPKRLIEQ